jgi:hypothetical protein
VIRRASIVTVLLAVNLALVLALAWLYHSTRSVPAPGEAAPAPLSASGAYAAPVLRLVKTNVVETNAFRWSQLETDDYRAFIQRLRAVGCPEQTIRDLVIADLDKLFAARLLAINPAARELHYWQPDNKDLETSADYRERQRQLREIDFAKRQVLSELLGVDLVAERNKVQGSEDRFGRRLGFLPDAKRGQVRMLLENYNDAELEIRQKTWEEGEELTSDDLARLKSLQEQRDQAITQALSEDELQQYQLAMSPLAYQVRDSLFGMNATEPEYLTVYGLRKEFLDKWSDQPPEDPEQRADWEQAQAELEAQLKQKLGDARYADYRRAQDPDYRELAIAAARYKVSAGVADEVYSYKQLSLEYRARVAGNRSLTPDQQQAALGAMAAETEQTVRAALGSKAYDYYRRSGQGAWISGQGN